jgi:hypothetical protein
MRLSRSCWVSSDTGHYWFETSLRSARLQDLPEVGHARLLTAMLGDLGVSTLRSIKTITQFSSPWASNRPSCWLQCSGTTLWALTPSCFLHHNDLLGNLFPIMSSLDLHFPSSSFLDARILLYECILDALWFFLVISIYWKSASYRSSLDLSSFGKTTNMSAAKFTCSFFFWTDVHAIRPVDSSTTSSWPF